MEQVKQEIAPVQGHAAWVIERHWKAICQVGLRMDYVQSHKKNQIQKISQQCVKVIMPLK